MEIKLHVLGMMCEHCEKKITKALLEIEGVNKVIANHIEESVIIDINDDTKIKIINKVIKKCGFKIK